VGLSAKFIVLEKNAARRRCGLKTKVLFLEAPPKLLKLPFTLFLLLSQFLELLFAIFLLLPQVLPKSFTVFGTLFFKLLHECNGLFLRAFKFLDLHPQVFRSLVSKNDTQHVIREDLKE